jgi:hypothetical protein
MRILSLLIALTAVTATGQPGGLSIVVIEGEGAVNIIQQKTAVAPMVEVRDRNNLPVPGAVVTFTIQAGPNAAVAGGAQTLTVTTNAAGRAAMAALNPVNPGTFQIQVQAAFQGQTAVAAITQTNVLTAAQAAGAAAGAGAGAGGGGGGLGGGAIAGIVGGAAAVAGVAVALPTLSGDESETDDGNDGGEAVIDPAVAAAAGVYTLQQINGSGLPALTVLSPPNPCPGFTDSGTMTLTARPQVFEMNERSHLQCSIGSGNTFNASNGGSWTLQGATITFAGNGQFNIGPGSLSGSTLTFDFDAPHANTGNPAFRVTSVWRK